MDEPRFRKARPPSGDLGLISQAAFVKGWTEMVGEPPAALLEDRRAMIEMLVQTAGIALAPWEEKACTGQEAEVGSAGGEGRFRPAPARLRRAG